MRGWHSELDIIKASWIVTQHVNPEKVIDNCKQWAKDKQRNPKYFIDLQTQITPDLSKLP